VVKLPQLKQGQIADLKAISALSHSDIWAVGDSALNGVSGKPLVLHFDGQRFKKVPFPVKSELGGVTAIAANDAWVTGSDGQTLAAHWDGKVWTRVPTPTGDSGTSSGLTGVSAVSSDSVWASGGIDDPNQGFLNLAEHWDGKSWSISPIPSFGTGFDEVVAALAFPSGSVFIAGTTHHCDVNSCGGFDSVVFHTNKGK